MKRILFKLFVFFTIVSCIGYIISCLTHYISPVAFWPMAFLALGYPYILSGIILLFITWLFLKRKVAILILVVIFAGSENLFSTFAINPAATAGPIVKDSNTLRIMTWNVRGFDNPSFHSDTPGSVRLKMFDYINEIKPDVICMQEFTEHQGRSLISNTTELLDNGYRYYYRTDEMTYHYNFGPVKNGTVIFSKIPLTGSGKVIYNDPSAPEHLAHVDIIFQQKPIRIFSTHLKSLSLAADLSVIAQRGSYHYDTNFLYTATPFEKIKVFAQEHTIEARIAKKEINNSPYPVVFCGDLNTVPTSYPYSILSAGYQDAFLQKGFGLGTTMANLPKSLRIDYLFIDKRLVIKNYNLHPITLSDHYPQYVDLSWKD